MSQKGGRVINGDRTPSNHANLWIFERGTHRLQGSCFGNHIGSNQHGHLCSSLFEKQIDGRGFPFTLLLHTQAHSRFLACYLRNNGHRPICTPTGNDDDFFDTHSRTLLFEHSTDGATNIGYFIIGHDTYTTANIFAIMLFLPIFWHRLNFTYTLCCHNISYSSLAKCPFMNRSRASRRHIRPVLLPSFP